MSSPWENSYPGNRTAGSPFRLTIHQATLLVDLLHAVQRKAPVMWLSLSRKDVKYGTIMAVIGEPDDDVRDCYAQIDVTSTRPVTMVPEGMAWAGEKHATYGHSNQRISGILEDMNAGIFIIDPAGD